MKFLVLICTLTLFTGCVSNSPQKHPSKKAASSLTQPLDPSIRQSLQDQFSHKVSGCYDKILKKNLKKEGEILLEWQITPQGGVAQPKVAKDTVQSRFLSQCLVYHLRKVRFHPSKRSKSQLAQLPLLFRVN